MRLARGGPLAAVLVAALATLMVAPGCQKQPGGEMVSVPAGKFILGAHKTDTLGKAKEFGARKPWYEDEKPEQKMYLKAFRIGKYEVTNDEYAEFVLETGHFAPPSWLNGSIPKGKERHSVVMVDWADADAYCRWIGGRLPTEFQWEKAARGEKGLEFPWGNRFIEKNANTGELGDTSAAGAYPKDKSPYGAFDMGGNVMEWTDSWYKPYKGSKYESKDFGEKLKVVRGGAGAGVGGHYLIDQYFRNAYRRVFPPEQRYGDMGFRCARDG